MNERIQELAYQAEEYADTMVDGGSEFHPEFVRKLAELIVQECCDVLQNEDIQHSGYGYNQGFLHKKIKEHFGVEE